MRTDRMLRSRPRVIAGVCSGLAAHLGVSVRAVRIAMVVAAGFAGAGIIFYLWLWLLVPDADDVPSGEASPGARLSAAGQLLQRAAARDAGADPAAAATTSARPAATKPETAVLIGAALVAIAVAILTGSAPLQVLVPIGVAATGLVLAWRQLVSPEQHMPAATAWQVGGGAALVAAGVVMFFITGVQGDALTVVGGAIAVLAGVGIAAAPWLLRLLRDLTTERAERARANERAEVAAHLHDSVLQTLALIRQKSAPDSPAARLARQQERELREWLFVRDGGFASEDPSAGSSDPADGLSGGASANRTGSGEPDAASGVPDDVASSLRRTAVRLERDYACQFEVVAVGRASAGEATALIAAANEAMTNAARHAGGSITVLVEATPDAVEATVADRGPGIDLDGIPADRRGIRRSIIDRMRRAGGSADIGPGPGQQGARVRLRLPRSSAEARGEVAPHAERPHHAESASQTEVAPQAEQAPHVEGETR